MTGCPPTLLSSLRLQLTAVTSYRFVEKAVVRLPVPLFRSKVMTVVAWSEGEGAQVEVEERGKV
jgi:hypothetical protein